MSASLGVWWCATVLAPVAPVVAQMPPSAVETRVGRSPGFVLNGSNNQDLSGKSVSGAGDVNGDGLDDVVVGAYLASPDGQSGAGRSYVVFGKRGGGPVELATLENGTSRDGFVINGSTGGDSSGYSVGGAGDVNGDGLDDVIVGADFSSPDGRSGAGRSYVVFGKRGGGPVELATLENGTSRDGFVINGSNADDRSGISVSGAGDVNGDGLNDVIVGTLRASPDGRSEAGRSYVVFGKHNTRPMELADIENGAGLGGFVINGSAAQDRAGGDVGGAGDVNGDGLDDVIVAANSAMPAGRSYVVFGKRGGGPVELATLEDGTSRDGFVINGSNEDGNSSGSVDGAGDVNGDGLDDVIVGASQADPDGRYNAGRSYVVFGKRNTHPVELAELETAGQNP
ncbi:MAG: integrin alpha [Aphanocapsa lilacina HA4352-LM1]|nr:integrin alpha [Aphanocapsa lilacina HA4352-LM1]